MNESRLIPVFSASLFASALLIFTVQPMVSKMLLPLLGGGPSVWNTAMVFFQAMLLLGYAYAHLSARLLPLKAQAILHLALLIGCVHFLPLTLPHGIAPPEESGQASWQLALMLISVGGPFFVLAASGPLFQHWFAASGHEDADNPYFLYAISNIGSMAALIGYPLVVEPFLSLSEQTMNWFGGYILLGALAAYCGWLVRGGKKPLPPLESAPDQEPVGALTRLVWIFLAFIPSSLMLGVTSIITTDLANAPLLWVLPLALYLTTFIIAFSKKPALGVGLIRPLCAYGIAFIILVMMMSGFVPLVIPMILAHLAVFFLCAQLCHGELALLRPSTSHLTEYYLLISFGGVLGGIFNALIAPRLFSVPMEYPVALALTALVVWITSAKTDPISAKFNISHDRLLKLKLAAVDFLIFLVGIGLCISTYYFKSNALQIIGTISIFFFLFIIIENRAVFTLVAAVALLLFQPGLWNTNLQILDMERNYFGVSKVYSEPKNQVHTFYHGTTVHGAQSQKPEEAKIPLTYYAPTGPTGDIFRHMDARPGPQKIAALGLGVGSILCYAKEGRHFDVFEIDPAVIRVAENPDYFSYLSGCKSPYRIILGDARLKLAKSGQLYDMIYIDTFSSDNIPVHIMTREAFEMYLGKLADNGIIAINISNRYLDLRPELTALAKSLGLTVHFKLYKAQRTAQPISKYYTDSLFAVLAKDPRTLAVFPEEYGWAPLTRKTQTRVWTDDYANILSSLIFLQ